MGTFQGSANISGSLLTATGGALDSDAFAVKYSASGTLVWAKGFGSGANDNGNGVGVDGAGNVFVTSRSGGTVNFGDGVSATGRGGYDITLAKFAAATGSALWGKMYGGSYTDTPNAVAVDSSGNVLVTGQVGSASNVDFGGGPITAAGIFVAKYLGSNGSYVWAKVSGGISGSTGYGVTADPRTGNVIVTGALNGAGNFGGGNVNAAVTGAFLAGYDMNGNYLWAKTFLGSDSFSTGYGTAVAIDGSGNIALTGQVLGGLNFDGNRLFGSGNYQRRYPARNFFGM